MRSASFLLLVILSLVLLAESATAYRLSANYSGGNFFSHFSFWTADDPTHGYVDYVSEAEAKSSGLIGIKNGGMIYIGADFTQIASGRGRKSVRLSSIDTWNGGLFIIDLEHMPEGCGTWPAWWFCGPNWPYNGEIDVIEGVNTQISDQTTLHTNAGCTMAGENTNMFTGHWGTGSNNNPTVNCDINAPNQYANQGCGIIGTLGSYGKPFNARGGGYYVLEWTGDFIRAFYFTKQNVPRDLVVGNPQPNNWGKPYAYFQFGSNCPASHFRNHQMIINLTFCGDWAGNVFSSNCPGLGSCESFVQNNPQQFKNAYWGINSIAIYQ